MTAKFALYCAITILVIWTLDAVDINRIFKQNRVIQATIFYFLIGLSMIYLVTNFLWDLFLSVKG